MKEVKHKIDVNATVGAVVGLMVLFLVVAELYPEFSTAGDSLNESGIPLGSFFVGGGIITLLLAVGLFYIAYRHFMNK